MNNDYRTWKKKELQEFLRKCDQPIFGNKAELVSRVAGAKSLGLDDVVECRVTSRCTLTSPLGENLKLPGELEDGWTGDCGKFPDFTEKELYNYLVLSKHRTYDDNPMSARRQLKAKVFYDEGHVQNIMCHSISTSSSHCYIKCNCLPSIPTKDQRKKPAYNTWVCLSKVTGRVHTAECNCVAGAGESCNHIAALLYGIADVTVKKSTGKLAATSKACQWIRPRQRDLSPKKSQDMIFRKFKDTDTKSSTCNFDYSKNVDLSSDEVGQFKQKLLIVNPNAAWLKKFACKIPPIARNDVLPSLRDINLGIMDNVDISSNHYCDYFARYFDKLEITKEQCELISKLTEGQSRNPLWMDSRRQRLTASKFGQIVRRKLDIAPDNLLKQILGYSSSFSCSASTWGKDHENTAVDSYIVLVRKQHDSLIVKTNGLIVNNQYPHLGASPDGLLYCSDCVPCYGVLEVKCPYRFRDMHPLEAAKIESFFCTLNSSGRIQLRRNHSYYYQVQGQLAITDRAWCDFVVWTNKGVEVERVTFDKELWVNVMLPKLKAFYCSAVIPELFTNRVKRGLKLYP